MRSVRLPNMGLRLTGTSTFRNGLSPRTGLRERTSCRDCSITAVISSVTVQPFSFASASVLSSGRLTFMLLRTPAASWVPCRWYALDSLSSDPFVPEKRSKLSSISSCDGSCSRSSTHFPAGTSTP